MIPTNTNVRFNVASKLPANLDAVFVFAAEGARIGGDAPRLLPPNVLKVARRLLEAEIVRGTPKEIDFDLLDMPQKRLLRVYAAGMGPAKKITQEAVRRTAGAIMRTIRRHRLERVAIIPPVIGPMRRAHGAESVVTGTLLAAFDFREFHGTAKAAQEQNKQTGPVTITLLSVPASQRMTTAGIERARKITDAQNFARTIACRPANVINPPSLARVAQQLARQHGLTCKVLDERQMKRLGMGGILAVGMGSKPVPPRMIALEYRPRGARGKSAKPLLVVGKSITFDTGGISIKPADKMGNMIYDKCGGMAVLGLMAALAQLRPNVHVVGILTSAENHISDTSYRPGDILTMYNGVTVEVTNTDAEGRLVLGDALAWGIETFKPAAVVDLATLTGGVVVALGHEMCGLMSNSDSLVEELQSAAADTGEKMWRLPIGPEQRDQIKSDHADIVNSAGRPAHVLQGGAFLSHFIPTDGSIPWAHLDIAGVADTEKELPYYGKNTATGFGVRTLVEWVLAHE